MKPGRALLIRMIALMGLLLLSGTATFAQTELSGYQNSYMKVLEIRPCLITVDGVAVEKGDTIIIMQMGGARLNADGSLLAISKAGHWQMNVVGGDPDYAAGTIPLKQQLVGYPDSFDISQGIQVIKLPRVSGDAVITEPLLGKPWDGGSGGVIALKVPGTLTLRADIIADALGYGQDFRTLPAGRNMTACSATDDNGLRGEGFGNTNNRTGSGPWGNGGGGGPNHNGGGGGGANFGAGGPGGWVTERPTCRGSRAQASGGSPYNTYENLPQAHLIMGGGGGAGHQNNGTGTDGARGGGIILIIADRIQSSGSFTMSANGDSARSAGLPVPGNAMSDGAGGGGAGGTIALYANTVGSGIRFVARGGKGGNVYGTERAGPGGGGGGGALLSRNPVPAGSFDLAGGAGGVEYAYLNTAWGAGPGIAGGTKSGLGQPLTGVGEISQLRFSTDGPLEFCRGGSVTLRVENGSSPATWRKMEEPSRSFPQGTSLTVTESGTYTAYTVVGSCELSGSKKVTVWEPPYYSIGSILTLNCPQPVLLGVDGGASRGTPPYSYLWETDDEEAIPADQREIARPRAVFTKDAKIKVTVTDANGCKYIEEFAYHYESPVTYHAPDVSTCQGEPVTIGTDPVGGTELITYAWTPADQLDDATLRKPTVLNPTANQRFIVTVTNYNGCRVLDTVDLTVRPLPKTTISASTVICPTATTQLVATGGKSYLWEPADGLSCTTCANPVARPSATTTYRVRITDAGGCIKTDSVTVTVRTPKISASLGTLDFGILGDCQNTATREFYLRNDDDTEILIDDPNLLSPYAVIEPGLPVTIKPRDSVRVVVVFSPIAVGTATAELRLIGSCGATSVIALTGQQQSMLASANLGGVNFGQVLSCEATPRDTTIIVTNNGTALLDLAAPLIGPVGAPYQVLYPAGARTLAPSDTARYIVRYTPGGAGSFPATLSIPYSTANCDGSIEVTFNATNVKPIAAADLAGIDFGELVGCDSRSDSSISLSNTGSVPVEVRFQDVPSGFKMTSSLPLTLLPGETRPIGVRFEPQGPGPAGGDLRLVYGECNDTIRVALNGSSQGMSVAVADSLHFGQLVFCDQQSKTLSLVITNTSAGAAISTIESVLLVGPFTTSITPGTTLPNNVPQSFQVSFNPDADGELSGSIEVTLQPCGMKRTIYLDGSRIDGALAVASAPAVSFGTVPQTQTATQTLRYRNTGSAPLTNVTLSGITAPFALVSSTPPLPATLAPGEELEVVVSYTGTSGLQNATVRAETEIPCRLTAEITLEGRGGLSATTVWIEDFAAAPGERVQVPLLAEGTGELGGLGVTSLKATVRYNRSLLIPVPSAGITEISRTPVAGDESQIDYTFSAPFQAGSPVATLAFIAALGETMAPTPVRIASFEWVNHPEITVATRNATFTLEEVCVTGDSRVIRGSGEVVLKPVRPNPVNTTMELEYEIVEDGRTELFISDLLGRRVAVLVSGEAKAGRYVLTVDATKLSSGTYIYVLQTPTERLSRMMEVVK